MRRLSFAGPGGVILVSAIVGLVFLVYWSSVGDLSKGVIGHKSGTYQQQAQTVASAPAVTVNVLTYNRPTSLQRLISSLAASEYGGDSVDIHFFIDSKRADGMEIGGPDPTTLSVVTKFVWPHGRKFISLRFMPAGLVANVLESWYPTSDNEYVLLAEDDIEVSTFWYKWLRESLANYRNPNDPNKFDKNLFGVSLYSIREVETFYPHTPGRTSHPYTDLNIGNKVYFYQTPCSWGAVYFPEHWRMFRHYVAIRHTLLEIVPVGPDSYSAYWGQSWIKFFYELIYFKGWYMLYPNFVNETSFSTNHVEPGVHTIAGDEHSHDIFTVPLMRGQYMQPIFPPIPEVLVMDLFFRKSSQAELRARGVAQLTDPRVNGICRCHIDCAQLLATTLHEVWEPSVGNVKQPRSSCAQL